MSLHRQDKKPRVLLVVRNWTNLDLSKANKAPFRRKSPLLVISEPTVLRKLSNGLNTSISVSKYTPPNLHIEIPNKLNNAIVESTGNSLACHT